MIYRWGVAALVLGMPWHEILVRAVPGLGPWDDAVVLLLAGALLAGGIRKREWPSSRLLLPMTAFLAVALLSGLLNGQSMYQTAVGIRALFPYMVAGLAAAQIADRPAAERLLRWQVAVAVLAAAYGVASYLAFRVHDGSRYSRTHPSSPLEAMLMFPYLCGANPNGWRLAGAMLNDNYMGDWLAMLLPLAFLLGARAGDRGTRVYSLFAAVLMTVALAWTFSRAAYVSFGVGLIFFGWKVDRRIGILLPVLALAAVLAATPSDRYRFGNLRKTEGGRIAAVRKAARVQTQSPLYGRGPGTAGVMDMHYARIAAQTGLLGLAAFGWLLAAALAPALRSMRKPLPQAAESQAALAGLLAMMVAAAGGDVWEIPQLAYTFWILAGLLPVLAMTAGEKPAVEAGRPGEHAPAGRIASAAGAGVC